MSILLADELLRLIQAHESGIADSDIQLHFKERYGSLPSVINTLLSQNRLKLFTLNGSLIYKAINEITAAKFDGLGHEQMLVYQVCERAGNKGIWTRDIKIATNISQQVLTKILKQLEQRNLLKTVRSVASKSKKLYMVFDVIPAKELTGGPWYTEQEFDHEFVDALGNFIVQYVGIAQMADIDMIREKIRISGVAKVELSVEELSLVLETLVYDGRLEEVPPGVLALVGKIFVPDKPMYKVSKPVSAVNSWTSIPCGMCPVASQCTDDGVISPKTCVYFTQWLRMSDSEIF